ncbi:MAG: GAF domain-containing protein [Epsilonproteobacteria bacterium]|nr:GAF domain-containing protein [Campylobacterota bacterium]
MKPIFLVQFLMLFAVLMTAAILWIINRYKNENYIRLFYYAFILYFFRYLFNILNFITNIDLFILLSNIFAFVPAIFFLQGALALRNRTIKGLSKLTYCAVAALGILWILITYFTHTAFVYKALPIFFLIAAANIFTGIEFFIFGRQKHSAANIVTGIIFILWGLHQADYPFLRPVHWFAPYGFALGSIFMVTIAISLTFSVIDSFYKDNLKKNRALTRRQKKTDELIKIVTDIHSVANEEGIFHKLIDGAIRLTGGQNGAFGIYKDGRMIFKEYLVKNRWESIDYSFKKDYGVPGHIIKTRQPYIANDTLNDPFVVSEIRKRLSFYNLINVPIIYKDTLLGCLEIHNKIGRTDFDELDQTYLEIIADNAAFAISNVRLVNQIEYANNKTVYLNKIMTLLRDINQMIAKRELISDIYRITCSKLVNNGIAGIAYISLYKDDLHIAACEGNISREHAKEICRNFFSMASDKPYVADNIFSESNMKFLYKLADSHKFRRAAFFPLKIENRIYGELFVSLNKDINNTMYEFLKELTGDIAVAIKLSAIEQINSERDKLFSSMREIYKMALNDASMEDIFGRICKDMRIIFNASLVWIGKKEKRGIIKPVAYEGDIKMVEGKLYWELERGTIYPFAEVLSKNECFVDRTSNNLTDDNGYKTEVTVPICRKNKIFGIMDIYTNKDIDETVIIMLKHIGNQLYVINTYLEYTNRSQEK